MAAKRNFVDRIRPLRRWAGRVELVEVRLFGGSLLSLLYRHRVLVLETTGRRSGQPRRTVLAYQEVDGQLVLTGGAGGQTALPDWVANLRAQPAVRVTRRRRTTDAVARELAGPERAAMWDRLLPGWPRIPKYEAAAGRTIPVIVLAPAREAAAP